VSTWKTDNTSTGSSASNQITLPLESTGTYDFTVDWGDGTQNTITSGTDANRTHTYATAGTYTVTINGTITGFRFNNTGDRQKITNISKFGPLRLGNNGSYFYGASNLTITATDSLDLTGTTSLASAFRNCTGLSNAPSMKLWDVSNVTDMSAMFSGARTFNEDITSWNVGAVTTMSMMFDNGCGNPAQMPGFVCNNAGTSSSFNQNIGNWNVANVTSMSYMFYGNRVFNQNIGNWNVSKVTSIAAMFLYASAFNQGIGQWDVSNVTDMTYTFMGTSAFNQNIENWNVSKVTSFMSAFANASAFNQDISKWNVTSGTSVWHMLNGATAFSRSNYDALLLGWSAQNVKTGLSFHAGSAKYSQSAAVLAARATLTNATASGGKG
ncbi:MAG: BspA family leucine-rich repeat surface protein, partial [Proteobacteria bacterium]|nr:BspA family leucine-rich repeat surface protein [Pseudomonadota bacterium]